MIDLRAGIILGTAFGAGVVVDEKALIPVGTAFAVGGMVWWLGRKLQRVDDKLEQLEDSISKLPCIKTNERCK